MFDGCAKSIFAVINDIDAQINPKHFASKYKPADAKDSYGLPHSSRVNYFKFKLD